MSGFLVCNLVILSLEISIQLVFFPFLFFRFYCCFFYSYIVIAITGYFVSSFLMFSARPCDKISRQSSMLTSSLLPTFLDTNSLFISSLGCRALCLVINFLVLWFICQSFPFVHCRNGLIIQLPSFLFLWWDFYCRTWNTENPFIAIAPSSTLVASGSVLSMGQIELNCVLLLNCIVWNRTVLTFKLCTYAKLNCLK